MVMTVIKFMAVIVNMHEGAILKHSRGMRMPVEIGFMSFIGVFIMAMFMTVRMLMVVMLMNMIVVMGMRFSMNVSINAAYRMSVLMAMHLGAMFMHVLMVNFLRCIICMHMVIVITVLMGIRLVPVVFYMMMTMALLVCFFLFVFF